MVSSALNPQILSMCNYAVSQTVNDFVSFELFLLYVSDLFRTDQAMYIVSFFLKQKKDLPSREKIGCSFAHGKMNE